MSSPFAARRKPDAGPSARTSPGVPRPTGDPVTDRAHDPAPIEHAHDMQEPIGGTSAAVPAAASAPAPAAADTDTDSGGRDPHGARSETGVEPGGSAMPDPAAEGPDPIPTHAQLDDLRKPELIDLAHRHGAEVESADTRATLIAKLDRRAGR